MRSGTRGRADSRTGSSRPRRRDAAEDERDRWRAAVTTADRTTSHRASDRRDRRAPDRRGRSGSTEAGPRPLPPLGVTRDVPLPAVVERTLPSGLRVLAVRRPSVPMIELRLRIPFADPAGTGWPGRRRRDPPGSIRAARRDAARRHRAPRPVRPGRPAGRARRRPGRVGRPRAAADLRLRAVRRAARGARHPRRPAHRGGLPGRRGRARARPARRAADDGAGPAPGDRPGGAAAPPVRRPPDQPGDAAAGATSPGWPPTRCARCTAGRSSRRDRRW